MKTVLVNCSDENFLKQRNLNTTSAKLFGGFDKIYSFSVSDIDADFKAKNEFILSQKRGAGYWLWKPYFVNKVYQELNDGDYIFYCDAGSLFINNVKHLVNLLKTTEQTIMPFELPLIEYEWTAESVLNDYGAFENGSAFSNQICATYILIKKCKDSDEFMQRWLSACQQPEHITDDVVLGRLAKAHRHDQSILSLLCKEMSLKSFRDPSDYGRFPFRYLSFERCFRVKKFDYNFPVIVVSYRKQNPYIYLIKFYIRIFLSLWRRNRI